MATQTIRTPEEELNGPLPQQAANNPPASDSPTGTQTETPEAGTETETPEAGTQTDSPGGTETDSPGGTETDSPGGTETDSPEAGTETDSPEAGTETDSPEAGTETDSPEAGTETDTPEAGTQTDTPAAGTQTDTPAAGTETDSQPGTESESENPANNTGLTAQNDSYTVASGEPLNVDVATGVLANDTGAAEGANLRATIIDAPDSGSYTFTSDGSFTYTSLDGFSGTDTFTYTASDGQSTSEPATVEINVEAPPPGSNTAPVAQNDTYTIAAGEELNVDVASGVLANDTDAEGDRLTATIVSNPTNGGYTFTSDGSFVYTPLEGFNGTDSFTYTVSDGQSTSEPATVEINVGTLTNTAPVVQNDVYTVASGAELNVDVASGILANDTDAEGNRLSATIVDPPDNGNFNFTSDGSFTYTSLEGFNGTDSFTYTVSDGELTSEVGTVAINVGNITEPAPTPEPQPTPTPTENVVNVVFDANPDNNSINSLIFDATPTPEGTNIVARLTDDMLDLGTDAAFDNLVGFYEIADANGSIDTNNDGIGDILPGQEGYALAAIENRINNFVLEAGSSGEEDENTSVEEFGTVILEGGNLYAPFIIANGGELGFDGFVESEASEGNAFNNPAESIDDAVAYFGFTAANPDGVAHLQARENNTFGFEDLPSNLGISDNDFNDAVFGFNFSLA
ncbi:MAG: tandem-95 repeat protein [Rivularia sp. (in: Bacteria)]|nr:tandem-95 repeat protein [Rivularia sp. MS3]